MAALRCSRGLWIGRYAAMFGAAMLLLGCARTSEIKKVSEKPVLEIAQGEKSKPIQFKKIVIKLKRGEPIGALESGLFCIPRGKLTYRGGRMTLTGDELTETFRTELEAANFTVVGNSDALFDDPADWKAEVLVAGLVTEMKANICYPSSGLGDYTTSRGEAYLKVNWQIYSQLDRKVVYEVTTEGASKSEQSSETAADDVFHNAFTAATRNLLADKGFHDLVAGATSAPKTATAMPVTVGNHPLFVTPMPGNMTWIRSEVATVFAGPGHGSGFFIDDGLLLTNQHVVGEATFVKVKFVTGREVVGEVLSSDARRDVALVRTEKIGLNGLPVSLTEIHVGEQVYAIGTPLEETNESTVSSGVLSGYRVEHGQRFIQSDVNILPGNSGGPLLDKNGNVIGLAVSGIFLQGAPSGINFFIPIGDAFGALGISRAAASYH
ncbi:MAG TPA: S1C family serine protease [Alphaproteobacteria bacterium]|jgi:S1-C subfamily serine protease|nr:S1C family serine protease [Alphaproteobacteria bacterium]